LRDRITALGGTPTMEVANKDLIHAKTLKEILDVNIREEIYYEKLFEGRHRPDLLSLGNV
jgi:bacterioferritin (cytochrome b1)